MRAALAVSLVAAAGALYLFDPAASALYPPCPFRLITGFACPGCGTLRALHQLLHGHPAEAFRLNPLTVALIPVLGLYWLSARGWAIRMTERAGRAGSRPHPVWSWSLLVLILTFWVVRNLSFYPQI